MTSSKSSAQDTTVQDTTVQNNEAPENPKEEAQPKKATKKSKNPKEKKYWNVKKINGEDVSQSWKNTKFSGPPRGAASKAATRVFRKQPDLKKVEIQIVPYLTRQGRKRRFEQMAKKANLGKAAMQKLGPHDFKVRAYSYEVSKQMLSKEEIEASKFKNKFRPRTKSQGHSVCSPLH